MLINERKNGNKEYQREIRQKSKRREVLLENIICYYEEFSTEFWKEPGSTIIPLFFTSPSGIPLLTPSTAIVDEQQTSSENLAPQSLRSVMPSTETSVVSRPVTSTLPSFSQSVNVINVTINYGGKSDEQQA
ncbi:hypothetical protein RhiirA5_436638 [Rhizophagus irregularis]|uniref:Uncharacterized protein n=1 Tax=Rhizophagus irregularis TaxID=588596 RepID=A0A2N0NLQ1_9GLOM|nr:hypothetical protein RhiirA5_436638 [Rhizophagus irregularis]